MAAVATLSAAVLGGAALAPLGAQEVRDTVRAGGPGGAAAPGWRMPPMTSDMPMIPGLEGETPALSPFLPTAPAGSDALPLATFRRVRALSDGDTLVLTAAPVRRRIRDRTFVMYGFNGQYPGPLIRVPEEATIHVDFRNELDRPTTVHWHGVRLENRFDGVPGVTQEPVEPGGRFHYEVHFVDPGVYWYHPHVEEHLQQDLGLYGNMLVEPADPDYYAPANREEVLILDDLLVDERGLVPWGEEGATHALMGRFGNLHLVNGEPEYRLEVDRGEVVRFFLTNVANTRTYHVTFGGTPVKVVAADLGRFERETRTEGIVIGPAQRYVVEVRFDEPGEVPITNAVQTLSHFRGEFRPRVDTLGVVAVADAPAAPDHGEAFAELRENRDVQRELGRFREHLDRAPDHELVMTVEVDGLHPAIMQVMALDTVYVPPVEFEDGMPMMNWLSTGREVRWILRDPETGRENMEIDWRVPVGEVRKIRLFNEPRSFHPMNHPIHLHGQRFLVVARDGEPNENLVWKDTVIVPVGSTVDVLVDFSNPGAWMLHCHIAEHLEAGMMTTIQVEGEP